MSTNTEIEQEYAAIIADYETKKQALTDKCIGAVKRIIGWIEADASIATMKPAKRLLRMLRAAVKQQNMEINIEEFVEDHAAGLLGVVIAYEDNQELKLFLLETIESSLFDESGEYTTLDFPLFGGKIHLTKLENIVVYTLHLCSHYNEKVHIYKRNIPYKSLDHYLVDCKHSLFTFSYVNREWW